MCESSSQSQFRPVLGQILNGNGDDKGQGWWVQFLHLFLRCCALNIGLNLTVM